MLFIIEVTAHPINPRANLPFLADVFGDFAEGAPAQINIGDGHYLVNISRSLIFFDIL